jgi:hypothetical protein
MDAPDRAGPAPARRSLPEAFLAATRPTQWVKNVVILVPAVFALRAADPGWMLRAILAVASFCFLSSATYLGNDIADRILRSGGARWPRENFRYRLLLSGP